MSLRRDLALSLILEMSSTEKDSSLPSNKYHLKYKQRAIASPADSFQNLEPFRHI